MDRCTIGHTATRRTWVAHQSPVAHDRVHVRKPPTGVDHNMVLAKFAWDGSSAGIFLDGRVAFPRIVSVRLLRQFLRTLDRSVLHPACLGSEEKKRELFRRAICSRC